jgi:hypothetical protein
MVLGVSSVASSELQAEENRSPNETKMVNDLKRMVLFLECLAIFVHFFDELINVLREWVESFCEGAFTS